MKVIVILLMASFLGVGVPRHYVSTTNISVGDTFTYTIELPSNIVASIAPSLNGLEIIESMIDRRPTATAHQFKVQVFSVESLMIPTVSLTEINGLAPMDLDPIFFNLVSLLTPTVNELNDISPVFNIWHVNWVLLTILLTVVMIGIMAVVAWKKKQALRLAIADEIKEPPIHIALRSIQGLKQQLSNDPMVIKKSYFQLTEIFCTYISDQTGMNVLDATTVEMGRLLNKSKRLPSEITTMILSISQRMDHYKFSQNPELNMPNIDNTINQVIEIIKKVDQ
jgi:hypothetical protein